MYVNCPICGEKYKKKGIHHHIQRKHENKNIKYHHWTESEKNKISLDMKQYIKNNPEEYAARGLQESRKHTEETKNILREKALKSKHRRLKKKTILYKGILLDSSWEFELAKRLDSINVKWIRPEPLEWFDEENIKHHYFPDFYLTEYDLYLDPKNTHAVKVQQKKLDIVLNMGYNIKILFSLEECISFFPEERVTGHMGVRLSPGAPILGVVRIND